MRRAPFKNVFSRAYYAFAAAIVFSAATLLPISLIAVLLLPPKMQIEPKAWALDAWIVVTFSICFIAAPVLNAYIPLKRGRN